MPISEVFQTDCNFYMKTIPDKFFELAIVDIPYGIESKISKGGGSHTKSAVKFHQLYSENGKIWDKASTPDYFRELIRVSKNQIIFGANYYNMPACRCFIIYDKPEMRIHTMSNCEFAWTSFDSPARIFSISRGYNCTIGIHPTQKPVKLYKVILREYAKEGDKIFDSHMGSQSSRIAAYEGGFDYYGCELDKDYFEAGCKRFEIYKQQLKLF
jgi:site-specific DNA-methyltransferase (adenine-specific)